MRGSLRATLIKFGVFAVVMAVLTAFLFFIFGQYRTGATTGYSAVFNDASMFRLQAGPYPTREEARGVAERVRSGLQLVPVIVERR